MLNHVVHQRALTSTFSLDTLALLRDGHQAQALWNVVGQVGLSLFGVGRVPAGTL